MVPEAMQTLCSPPDATDHLSWAHLDQLLMHWRAWIRVASNTNHKGSQTERLRQRKLNANADLVSLPTPHQNKESPSILRFHAALPAQL